MQCGLQVPGVESTESAVKARPSAVRQLAELENGKQSHDALAQRLAGQRGVRFERLADMIDGRVAPGLQFRLRARVQKPQKSDTCAVIQGRTVPCARA
jgi:hypothetical protein